MQKTKEKHPLTSLILGLIIFGGCLQNLKAEAEAEADELLRSRQAPFCIDETNTSPIEKGLEKFVQIFQFHDANTYITVGATDKDTQNEISPSGMIKKIEFTTIDVKDTDSGYKDVLKNWLHVTIESHIYLEGLYIQAVSSPWGVPFGEFIANFDCSDCDSKTSMLKNYTHIIPCIHRGGLGFNHPNILTIGGETGSQKVKFKKAHFNFRYTQFPCYDHTYAQFLIVAVRNFHDTRPRFETFWTKVYELNVKYNPIGAYFPFYYGWNTRFLKCHASTAKPGDIKLYTGIEEKHRVKIKLMVNGEYDHCVRKREATRWYTCPPGPVKFTSPPTTLSDWETFRNSFKKANANNGNPSPDPDNSQFCYDAGQWEWNVGQSSWQIPDIIWGNGSVLPTTPLEEDELEEICEAVSINGTSDLGPGIPGDLNLTGEVIICTIGGDPPVCIDPHASNCDASTIFPTYGKINGTRPETFNWTGNVTLSEQFDEIAWRWGKKHILRFHGQLLIFAWVVAYNILAYIARYLKEDTIIEKKSGYIGIGNWIWYHMMFTYIFIATAGAGIYLVSNHHVNKKDGVKGNHDLCNIHSNKVETDACLYSDAHKYIGYASCIGFGLSYFSGWTRARVGGIRKMEILFHIGGAYIGKLAALLAIMTTPNGIPTFTTVYIILMEFCAILMFVAGGLMISFADKRNADDFETKRKWFPVPEEAPYSNELTLTHSESPQRISRIPLLLQERKGELSWNHLEGPHNVKNLKKATNRIPTMK
ncbi:unnamed protein product [Orchesella dallaii]|uniref:Uncharacterized protein n=1 Tax=Orchesella dallaii TaxID=48710 RepID=A0ABP1QPF5_9HEXA